MWIKGYKDSALIWSCLQLISLVVLNLTDVWTHQPGMLRDSSSSSELLHKPLGSKCASGACLLFFTVLGSCSILFLSRSVCCFFPWLCQSWSVWPQYLVALPSWQQVGESMPRCMLHLNQAHILLDDCFRINIWKHFLILAQISQEVPLKFWQASLIAGCRAVRTCPDFWLGMYYLPAYFQVCTCFFFFF